MLQRFTWLTLILLACAQLANAEAPGLKKIKDIIIYKDASYYSAFPSIVQRQDGELLCAFRRAPDRKALWGAPGYTHTDTNSYLVLVRSRDNGETWTQEANPVDYLGDGNPPMLNKLADGRLCLTYGFRGYPYSIRARLSSDNGKSWGPQIVLREDGTDRDIGYVRSIVRPDGKMVTTYYINDEQTGPERYIGATIWDPDKITEITHGDMNRQLAF